MRSKFFSNIFHNNISIVLLWFLWALIIKVKSYLVNQVLRVISVLCWLVPWDFNSEDILAGQGIMRNYWQNGRRNAKENGDGAEMLRHEGWGAGDQK